MPILPAEIYPRKKTKINLYCGLENINCNEFKLLIHKISKTVGTYMSK